MLLHDATLLCWIAYAQHRELNCLLSRKLLANIKNNSVSTYVNLMVIEACINNFHADNLYIYEIKFKNETADYKNRSFSKYKWTFFMKPFINYNRRILNYINLFEI